MKLRSLPDPPRSRTRYSRFLGGIVAVVFVLLIFSRHDSVRFPATELSTPPTPAISEQETGAIIHFDQVDGPSQQLPNSATSSNPVSDNDAPPSTIPSPIPNVPFEGVNEASPSTFASSTIQLEKPSGEPVAGDIPLDHSNPRSRMGTYLQTLLEWSPPLFATLHSPSYKDYLDRDYDPNRWEGFEKNKEIFTENTSESDRETLVYRPYSKYNSAAWRKTYRGDYVPCQGLAGALFNESERELPKAYKRQNIGPATEPFVGSFEAIGLDGSVCFDRYSRLGPFGQKGAVSLIENPDLGQLQNRCLERNHNRYADSRAPDMRPGVQTTHSIGVHSKSAQDFDANTNNFANRTAVLIRAWEGYEYEENDIVSIRSLVSELALQSGGEYHVFLMVMLTDGADVNDQQLYDEKLKAVPRELRSMTIFWSEKLCAELYPSVGEYRVNRAQFMPVQWFMETHPEFEFVWNHELDARYIGHHYHFLQKVTEFARKQPRKYLWERNARFYFPAVHGSFENFTKDSNWQIEHSPYTRSIWGPQWIAPSESVGPLPPTPIEQDSFEWGVDEEADFVCLLPLWNPRRTTWGWKDMIYNYPAPAKEIPMRAYINTHGRYSRRLLHAMHQENLKGRLMASELWPSTIALHHSLKAVYVPHPIWTTHKWPSLYADAVFNADGWGAGSFRNASEPPDDGPNQDHAHPSWGRGAAYDEGRARLTLPQAGTGPNGEGAMARWSQERDSVYNLDREHNFLGWSWYYASDFGRMIYWRWLGWRQSYSIFTMGWTPEYDEFKDIGTATWEAEHGRLCMPPMLLHPVKRVHEPTQLPSGEWVDKGECKKSGC
ncbi:MAG: hypothetical protein Q9162_005209 [Coniocarpon cinnabarinum]